MISFLKHFPLFFYSLFLNTNANWWKQCKNFANPQVVKYIMIISYLIYDLDESILEKLILIIVNFYLWIL